MRNIHVFGSISFNGNSRDDMTIQYLNPLKIAIYIMLYIKYNVSDALVLFILHFIPWMLSLLELNTWALSLSQDSH